MRYELAMAKAGKTVINHRHRIQGQIELRLESSPVPISPHCREWMDGWRLIFLENTCYRRPARQTNGATCSAFQSREALKILFVSRSRIFVVVELTVRYLTDR